jgi:hypothetical protein
MSGCVTISFCMLCSMYFKVYPESNIDINIKYDLTNIQLNKRTEHQLRAETLTAAHQQNTPLLEE